MHFRLYVTGTMVVNVGCLFDWIGEPLRDIFVDEYVRVFQEGLAERRRFYCRVGGTFHQSPRYKEVHGKS